MKTDSIFYEIFQNEPTIICELLGKTDPRTSAYEFGSQEVKETSFRLDGILVPPVRMPDLPIIFVEVQGYSDAKGTLYSSFFSEIFLYLHDYQPANDWESVLIFTKRSLDPGLPKQYDDFAESTRFRRIYLDELDDAAELSIGVSLLKLVVTSKQEATVLSQQLVARSRAELTDARNQQSFVELVVTILVYKLGNVDRAEIEAMIMIPEIRQSRFYQVVKEKGIEEGIEKGRISAVSALLKSDLALDNVAELLDLDLLTVRRAAIPYLLEHENQLDRLAERWELPLAEIEKMAIASLTILGKTPEDIATQLGIDPTAVQSILDNLNHKAAATE
ncbi:MAG: Rpn family recombination-promoting nuclease/putative transposase [Cyanobacteria bacterium J06621_3]